MCHSVRQLLWKVGSVSGDLAGIKFCFQACKHIWGESDSFEVQEHECSVFYQNIAVKLLFRCYFLSHMQPVLWGRVLERLRCVDTVHIRANVCTNLTTLNVLRIWLVRLCQHAQLAPSKKLKSSISCPQASGVNFFTPCRRQQLHPLCTWILFLC